MWGKTLIAVCFLAFSQVGYSQMPTAPTSEASLRPIEATLGAGPESILTARTLDVLSKNKEQVYLLVHLKGFGHATGITVQDVKILAWEDGKPVGQLNSVKQFALHFTLFWTSVEHPSSGVTELLWTCERRADGKCYRIGSQVIKTNGITKDKALTEVVPLALKLGLHGL